MAAFIKASSNRLFSILPTHSFGLYQPDSDGRGGAEQAVKRIFRQVYNADISDFSTLLITAESEQNIDAVIGLRNAGQAPLFLESYMDQPIEQILVKQHGLSITRDNLIEIGNLVAIRSGTSRQLFIMLAFALAKAGVEWVTFTATAQVEQLLTKLGLAPVAICKAQHQAVVNGESSWGSYYENPPTVCYGNVKQAIEVLKQAPTVSAIYPMIEPVIERLASQISQGFQS